MVVLQLLDSSAGRSPLQITADPTDSITHIRSQISSLHPASPAVGDIRLVRGGRLLRDGETVLDVLGGDAVRAEQHGPHLIHLVLRPGKQQPVPAPTPAAASSPSVASSSTLLELDGRPVQLPAGASAASPASPPASSAAAPTPRPASTSTSASPPVATQPLSYYHALADALALYSYLAEDALREMQTASRLSWEGQQPAPLVSLAHAKALVRQTMDAVGIDSALGDAMDLRRRLDEWVRPEGQELEVSVDGQPFALAIPPLSTLSTDEQYTIQRYLMFTTRLSLLEALLRAHPPGPFPAPSTTAAMPPPTPTPAVSPAVNRNQVAAVMTLLAMNLIKYVIVWWIFTQDDDWFDSCLWAAGLTAVWLWEAWKGYRRLQPTPPVVRAATANPAGPEAGSTDPGRPLPPLPTFRLPSAATPFHALLATGLQTETDRLRLSPPPTSARQRAAGLPRPSILKPLLLPPFLLICSIVPPLEAYRRRLIHQRETAMRALSEALTARAPAEPDSVDSDVADQPRRLVPDGLPGAAERDYWQRVLEREDRVDWAEEEEAQRRLGGERDDRDEEEAGGGLLALLF